jgi:hypothetical protein
MELEDVRIFFCPKSFTDIKACGTSTRKSGNCEIVGTTEQRTTVSD